MISIFLGVKFWFLPEEKTHSQTAGSSTDQTIQGKPSFCFKRTEDEIWFDCVLLYGFDCIQLIFVFLFL